MGMHQIPAEALKAVCEKLDGRYGLYARRRIAKTGI